MEKPQKFNINYCSPEIIKKTGSHYTPTELSDFIADHILLNFEYKNNDNLNILDPSVGDGELLLSMLKKVAKGHEGKIKIYGYDTNAKALSNTRNLISSEFPKVEIILKHGNFLISTSDIKKSIDLVISNPPYVRTQVMGASKAQDIAKFYGLEGRVDLYYAFFPAIREVLKDNGTLGIVTSNRFMSTKSGESIREILINNFNIHEVWDFGDTKIFEAAVLPCVLIMSPGQSSLNKNIIFSSCYTSFLDKELKIKIKNIHSLFSTPGLINYKKETFEINSGFLEITDNQRDVWKISNNRSKDFLKCVAQNTKLVFQDIGKIRVGVKTTADKVFIRTRKEWRSDQVEEECLNDLTTHHIAERWYPQSRNRDKQILYTHYLNNEGKLQVKDFVDYPKATKYLNSHKERLSSRSYILKASRKWYEIWVPQNPNAWPKNKIVFRDIAKKPTFWFDNEGSVINGDCYWFINTSSYSNDILWLALAVANSDFIVKFYEYKFNNKLYSGRCRFMTQYVNQFPVPDPTLKESKQIIKLSIKAYKTAKKSQNVSAIEEEINTLVWNIFKVKKH